ncbi:hypothetical protein B566_EDAN013056 [Ephemera danica]|nr:hypothetical protein B566_EDAN013056 [Ephemera danica]
MRNGNHLCSLKLRVATTAHTLSPIAHSQSRASSFLSLFERPPRYQSPSCSALTTTYGVTMDTTNISYNESHESVAHGPNRDPLYVVIPITIIYALIFVAGVVGNVITCIVIRRNKHMHTTTNLYLFR